MDGGRRATSCHVCPEGHVLLPCSSASPPSAPCTWVHLMQTLPGATTALSHACTRPALPGAWGQEFLPLKQQCVLREAEQPKQPSAVEEPMDQLGAGIT